MVCATHASSYTCEVKTIRHRGMRKIIMASAVVVFLSAAVLWQVSKARCLQLVGEVTCRIDTDTKLIALTFDDGPTPEGVDAVLAELGPRGISATFFLIGNRMEKFPGQAERLIEAGHELGNHTYTHQRNIGHSQDFYAAEIARTDALLNRAGSNTNLFRPPSQYALFAEIVFQKCIMYYLLSSTSITRKALLDGKS